MALLRPGLSADGSTDVSSPVVDNRKRIGHWLCHNGRNITIVTVADPFHFHFSFYYLKSPTGALHNGWPYIYLLYISLQIAEHKLE